MKILLTGGTGYIGSHVATALISTGHAVVCFDNLANSDATVIDRLEAITGTAIPLVVGDIRDGDALRHALTEHGIEAVIHFAGLKAVGESVAEPIKYYDNNVRGTLSLVEAMSRLRRQDAGLFIERDGLWPAALSATRRESSDVGDQSLWSHQVDDRGNAERHRGVRSPWRIATLRYFNPVGAHDSGLIGENPNGIPNNLMPFISRVAAGRLANCRCSAMTMTRPTAPGCATISMSSTSPTAMSPRSTRSLRSSPALSTWNLGTGQGYSVLDMVQAFERVNGVSIPYRIAPRRDGDVASCYASPERAAQELGWTAQRDLDAMCASSWSFERTLAMRNSG